MIRDANYSYGKNEKCVEQTSTVHLKLMQWAPFEMETLSKNQNGKIFSMELMKYPLEKREKNYGNAKYSLTNIGLYQVCMRIILSDHVISYLPSINIQ